ncbi:unnamed protein product, partial [Choristocarpus tenellus]
MAIESMDVVLKSPARNRRRPPLDSPSRRRARAHGAGRQEQTSAGDDDASQLAIKEAIVLVSDASLFAVRERAQWHLGCMHASPFGRRTRTSEDQPKQAHLPSAHLAGDFDIGGNLSLVETLMCDLVPPGRRRRQRGHTESASLAADGSDKSFGTGQEQPSGPTGMDLEVMPMSELWFGYRKYRLVVCLDMSSSMLEQQCWTCVLDQERRGMPLMHLLEASMDIIQGVVAPMGLADGNLGNAAGGVCEELYVS